MLSSLSWVIPDRPPYLQLASLAALSSSHAFIAVRGIVRHILLRVFWERTPEQRQAEKLSKQVKEVYLRTVQHDSEKPGVVEEESTDEGFWARDDARGELQRRLKEA